MLLGRILWSIFSAVLLISLWFLLISRKEEQLVEEDTELCKLLDKCEVLGEPYGFIVLSMAQPCKFTLYACPPPQLESSEQKELRAVSIACPVGDFFREIKKGDEILVTTYKGNKTRAVRMSIKERGYYNVTYKYSIGHPTEVKKVYLKQIFLLQKDED